MQDLIFYLFAALTIIFGIMVVANPFSRNPVTSAMFLVLTIISLAVLFIGLHALFLAAVQVLVYAGAVMVLFLFVIMLLDLKEEEHRQLKIVGTALGTLAVGTLAAVLIFAIHRHTGMVSPAAFTEGDAKSLGMMLFNDYLLPFEIVSILLLVAMVGAILLSKKELK